jgi:hypothetical protein
MKIQSSAGAGILMLLLGLGAGAYGVYELDVSKARNAVLERGERTEGQITSLRRGGRRSRGHYVDYQFTVSGRVVVADDREVYASDWGALRVGQPVAVWYDALDPARCVCEPERRYVGSGYAVKGWIFIGVAVVCGLIGAVKLKEVVAPSR